MLKIIQGFNQIKGRGDQISFYSQKFKKAKIPYKVIYAGDLIRSDWFPKHIKYFVNQEKVVSLIPIVDLVAFRGVLFRSLTSRRFRVVKDDFPLFFGFYRFKGFTFGRTVFITEGIKDSEAVAREYPFVLAGMGVRISTKQSEVLKRLTSKFIFVADNDKMGKRNKRNNMKM